MAVMLCFIVQFDALSYTFNWMCPNDTVVNLDNYKSLHTTTITGAIPAISGQNGKCTTTNIGGSDGGVGALKYWVCLYGNSLPSDSITQEPTIVNISGYVFEANKTYSSTLTNNSVVWCTPALIVHGMDTSNIFIDTKWYPLNANLPNITRFYTICNINQLPSGSTPGTIQNCNSRTYVINTQKNAFGTSGDTFWFIKHNAALSNVLTANDNYALIDKLDGWGGNTNLQYFYTRQSEIDEKAYGYEISFKCSENDTTPFARIVWPGNNGSTTPALSDSLKAAVAAKARTTCGSAFNMTNRQMWCNGYATNPKAGTGSNGLVYIRDGESVYFPNGGDCFFPITCEAGTYLPANSSTCAICPQHYYCPGGDFIQSTADQGKNSCAEDTGGLYKRTYSQGGYSAITSCQASVGFHANGDNVLATADDNAFTGKNISAFYRANASVYAASCSAVQPGASSGTSNTSWCYRKWDTIYLTTTPNIKRERYTLGGWMKCLPSSQSDSCATVITKGTASSASPYGPTNSTATLFTTSDVNSGGTIDLYARWNYKIQYNPNGANGTAQAFYNISGVPVTTKQPSATSIGTKTGYTFVGWCVNDSSCQPATRISAGDQICDTASCALSNNLVQGQPNTNSYTHLHARWEPNTYNVTYDCGTGTGTPPASQTATYDSSFTPAADTCSKPGYVFAGWAVSGTTSVKPAGIGFTWTYTTDKTFTAEWVSNCPSNAQLTADGCVCDDPNATYNGNDCTCKNGYHENESDPDAPCVPNRVQLNYLNGGHGNGSATDYCDYGGTFTMPSAFNANGYSFDKWATATNALFNAGETNISCNELILGDSVLTNNSVANITATWTIDEYQITYDFDGQNLPSGMTNPATYTVNDDVQLNNPIKSGYDFNGWCRYDSAQSSGGNSCISTDTNYIQPQTNPASIIAIAAGSTGAKWFYSKWGAINYNVTYDCGTGTGTPPPNTLQTFGTNFTVANTDGASCSKTGYHFVGWACKYLDGNDGAPDTDLVNNTTYDIAVNALCTAQWDANTLYLQWNNDNGTTGITGATSCSYDGIIDPIQTVTRNGYNFAGWDVVSAPGRGTIEDKY